MGVAGFLRQKEDRAVVRQPAEVAKGVVDPGRVGPPVQGTQFAGFEVDSGDPAVLVIHRVDLYDGPCAVAVEGHRAEADRPGLGLVLTGLLVLLFDGFRSGLGLGFAAGCRLRRRFPSLLPLARRFAQVRQRVVGDPRQHGEVQRHGLGVAGPQQEQRLARSPRRADLRPHLLDVDHPRGGDVVRHPVAETFVAFLRTGTHDQAVERGRECRAGDFHLLAQVVGQGRPAGVAGLTLPEDLETPFLALAPQAHDLEQPGLLALQVAGPGVLLRARLLGLVFRANVERLPQKAGLLLPHEPDAGPPEGEVAAGGEEGRAFRGDGAGDLDQPAVTVQVANEDVAGLDEGPAPPLAVPVAAGGVRIGTVAVGEPDRRSGFEVDAVEITGVLACPLALEVDAVAVAAPVRALRLATQPIGMGHDPFEGDIVLGPEGKDGQEQARGQGRRAKAVPALRPAHVPSRLRRAFSAGQKTRGNRPAHPAGGCGRSNGQAVTGTRSTRSWPGLWPLPDGWGPPPGTS